jgi:hypothetical protein
VRLRAFRSLGGDTSGVSLLLVVVLLALAAGRLAGGSLERLGSLPLRERRLLAGAVLAQLLGVVVGGPAHAVGLAASAAFVVAFLALNRGVRGTGLVALGLLANALVVGANDGAMPVSSSAAARAGVGTQDLLTGADPRHVLADEGTRLRRLGDVVPVPLPLRPEVVSPGDVLVAAGAAQLLVSGMLRPLRPVPPLPPAPPRPAGARDHAAGAPGPGRRRRALPAVGPPVRRRGAVPALPPRSADRET